MSLKIDLNGRCSSYSLLLFLFRCLSFYLNSYTYSCFSISKSIITFCNCYVEILFWYYCFYNLILKSWFWILAFYNSFFRTTMVSYFYVSVYLIFYILRWANCSWSISYLSNLIAMALTLFFMFPKLNSNLTKPSSIITSLKLWIK